MLLIVGGASSQWAETIRICLGLSISVAQVANSPDQRWSSTNMGAPWLIKRTGWVVSLIRISSLVEVLQKGECVQPVIYSTELFEDDGALAVTQNAVLCEPFHSLSEGTAFLVLSDSYQFVDTA